jgi:hypothetical protein
MSLSERIQRAPCRIVGVRPRWCETHRQPEAECLSVAREPVWRRNLTAKDMTRAA